MADVRSLCLGASVVLLAASCGDDGPTAFDAGPTDTDTDPVVSISATPTSGLAPLQVQFFSVVNGGDGALDYAWDFGDGATSDEPNPAHEFDTEGTHMVTLTVTDEDGDAGGSAIAITVGADDAPTVTAAATPTTGAAPLSVDFDCTVAGGNAPVQVRWSFGDGNESGFAVTGYTYTTPGSYQARCTAEDANGDVASDTVDITVGTNSIPEAVISAAPGSGPAPLDVDFVGVAIGGDGAITYDWSFGDGGTDTGAAVTHTFAAEGVYAVVLTVTDADGDTGTDTFTVEVTDSTPVVEIIAAPTSGVAPLVVDFIGAATGGDGALTFDWDFGDGGTDTGAAVTHTYAAEGVYAALLTVTDADGDTGTDTVLVEVAAPDLPPVVTASVAAGACAVPKDTLVQLDATGSADPEGAALMYQWLFETVPAGSTAAFNNATVANPTFVPDLEGDYTMRVFVSDGVNVTVSGLLTVTARYADDIVIVSGSPQTGTVGELLPEALVVASQNGCGAIDTSTGVTWVGSNATPTAPFTATAADGTSTNTGRLRTVAGAASITATLANDRDSVTFDLTADPGPPAMLAMDDYSTGVPVSATPTALTFRVTDQYGNPTTGADVTFDLYMYDPSSALFDDCDPGVGQQFKNAVTTSGGTATVDICNTVAEDVYIDIVVTDPVGVIGAGWVTLLDDDMEQDQGGYSSGSFFPPGNVWERGTPTYPAGVSAFSGVAVRGTELDGPVVPSPSAGEPNVSFLNRSLPSYPVPAEYFGAQLSFQSYLDIEDTGFAGCPSNANLSLFCPGCELIEPVNVAYDSFGCYGPGFSGPAGGWTELVFDLGPYAFGPVDLFWNLWTSDVATGAGWYIDDLRYTALVSAPRVRFVAGPPAQIVMSTGSNGVASCAPATVRGLLTDAFGNPTSAAGVNITLTSDSATAVFSGATVGDNFIGGATATVDTAADGDIDVEVTDSAGETVEVSGVLTSGGTPTTTFVDFASVLPEETGLCGDGVDNDCDGATDCDDDECSLDPLCAAEADCLNGIDDNGDGLTDCEAPECMPGDVCQTFFTSDLCNGFDEGNDFPIPELDGYVDEFGCQCIASDGCDDLDTGIGGLPYVCDPTFNTCAPNCAEVDYCEMLGLGPCDPGTGTCDGGCFDNDGDSWCVADGDCDDFDDTVFPGAPEICDGKDNDCNDIPDDGCIIVELCLDGIDNDGDGLTDCEDDECWLSAECDTGLGFLGPEQCNGEDDGVMLASLPPGLIDEAGCNCVADAGCDDIPSPFPYACHIELAPLFPTGNGACGPDCNIVDWCGDPGVPFPLVCDVDTGHCVQAP